MIGRWILLAVLGLSTFGLAACASSTPLCDQAASLLAAGRLDDAAVTYAESDIQGEGDCAQSGRDAVESAFGDAAADVARGRSAEGQRDVDGAVSAYQAALGIDSGNAADRDGLTRLRAPAPALRLVAPPPPRVPVVVTVPWWPFVLAAVLVVAVLLAGWWWTRSVLARIRPATLASPPPVPPGATPSRTDPPGPEPLAPEPPAPEAETPEPAAAAPRGADDIRAELAGIRDRLDALGRDGVAVRRSVESRLDDIADQLDDDARARPPEHRRFVRPE